MTILTEEVVHSMRRSVLCWLATSDRDNTPNVSPKEMFTHFEDDVVLIAHLISPVSVRNVEANPRVCVSFVDVFVQKGFKLKGEARVVARSDPAFAPYARRLADRYSDKWPIKAVIEVKVTSVAPIRAPSYLLFPDTTTEASQIESAMRTYGVKPDRA